MLGLQHVNFEDTQFNLQQVLSGHISKATIPFAQQIEQLYFFF